MTDALSTDSQRSATLPVVLVVDDERNIRRTLQMVLAGEGYQVLEAESAEQALEILHRPELPVDLAIFDLKLPKMSGLDALERLRAEEATKDLPVIVISGHATVHDAVNAIKFGASDFFEKPLNRERVLVSVGNCIRTARLSRTVEQMRSELEARYEMIGTSPVMQRLYQEIDKVAPTKASVLITGESGTGKELVSRAIHRLSRLKDAPFVKVNCAAIPRELIESELFGHERGSFTGAQGRKRGYFEQAHGGTLFLDEIGDMDLAAQAKVLRALQNGEVVRVGSEHVLHVDVRVLAATNKDLAKEVQTGSFREDLLFRLDVFPIRVPALRERIGDLRLLAESLAQAFCRDNGLRAKRIDPAVFTALEARKWPGNVRELKNVVERAAILSSDIITIADLPEDPHLSPFDEELATPLPVNVHLVDQPGRASQPPADINRRPTLRECRDQAERSYIVETLTACDWNISKAATILGVERTNLHKKIRAYAVRRGE
jgi:two-component system, NtrC family, nitrogen regulation response regulator NtrX